MTAKSFKEFAFKGNIVDMAVGVVIGGAFGAIVSSLVKDVITPLVGMLFKADFSQLYVALKSPDGQFFPAVPADIATITAAQEAGYITFNYGSFITSVINFLILAFAMYTMLKAVGRAIGALPKKKKAEPAPAPTTKKCPYCLSEINIAATRCPHCTSEQPKDKQA